MKRSDHYSDIREIADAVCEHTATPAQLQTLEQRLQGDSKAQRFYAEYIRTHAYLSATEVDTTVIYRRITEELIINPQAHAALDSPLNTIQGSAAAKSTVLKPLWIVIATVLIAALISFLLISKHSPDLPRLIDGQLSIQGQGTIDGDRIAIGEYKAEQASRLRLATGDELQFSADTVFKLFNDQELHIKQGSLILTARSTTNLNIHGPQFTLESHGGNAAIDLRPANPQITGSAVSRLVPSRWRPEHFWRFEGNTDRVIDSANNAYGIAAIGATRTQGLVGQGAYYFDNSVNAHIDVGSGGGTAPATGSFSVTDGVTIEALIHTQYSGSPSHIDEIFRKDNGDGEMRLLLSFQNDKNKDYLRPTGDVDESLSFGLYIVGQGYHELKLALDGQQGRPTLEILRAAPHHIAATYNVSSGLKAIYINGQLQAHYAYPPGSKMLSGGPGLANIGNNPNKVRWEMEAFSGVIDEVAFYNFSLPEYTIQQHYTHTLEGNTYFGRAPTHSPLPMQHKITLPPNHRVELDPLTGLPQRLGSTNSR